MADEKRHELQIPLAAVSRVLQGVMTAVKASEGCIYPIMECLRCYGAQDQTAAPIDPASTKQHDGFLPSLSRGQLRRLFASKMKTQAPEMWPIIDITLAIAYLRETAHRNLNMSASDIDEVWVSIYSAIMDAKGDGFQISAVRSAQGFLAVPLCSLIESGKIEELWRLHVWLPDQERGVSDVVVHAHQCFAQSWILAGCGTDHVYSVQETPCAGDATHALYDCCYTGSGQAGPVSSAYKTHQLSSTVSNTGKYVRARRVHEELHTRDMTYTVPGGKYHTSEVDGNRFHATLFVFDASRGYDDTAGVLGPLHGQSYTQLRDSNGITAQVLAQITQAARAWEQRRSFTPVSCRGEEHPTILAYYKYFRGMSLLEADNRGDAMRYLSCPDGKDPAHVFASDIDSKEHLSYLSKLIDAGIDLDITDQYGCSLLDYAVYHDEASLQESLVIALQKQLGERRTGRRLYEAHIRKAFRQVFEHQLRPILLRGNSDGLLQIRSKYVSLLQSSEDLRAKLDGLRYMSYADFISSPRLPRYTDGVLRTFASVGETEASLDQDIRPQHMIYVAYRWILRDPVTGKTANDDEHHTQFRRMRRAIEDYLTLFPDVNPSTLGIWLDSVCIDRKIPLPGIAALPINLAQCDTLITIEDAEFWSRAWCSVEAYMMQKLRQCYPYYKWYQYCAGAREEDWSLREAPLEREVVMADLSMTWEEDRDKITFLQRQANLL